MLLPLLLISACLSQAANSKYFIPPPPGPCNVQITPVELVDSSRVDPFSPDHSKRAIMVSSYVPIDCGELEYTPYLKPKTATVLDQMAQLYGIPFQNGTSKNFMIETKSNTTESSLAKKEYPVIIFSPGMASARLIYSTIVEAVASMGFVVVSVDHPYDSAVVEFPDGRSIDSLGVEYLLNHTILDLETRAKDLSFTLDQLSANPKLIPSTFKGSLNLNKVAAMGHSFGGASSAQVMLNDTRFVGGMNFDGELWGSVLQTGLDRPFINFGEGPHVNESEQSWAQFRSHSTGFKRQLKLKDSYHITFSDLPLLVEIAALSTDAKANATSTVGTLPGLRVRTILSDYMAAAARYFIEGTESPLFDGASADYPEVVLMAK